MEKKEILQQKKSIKMSLRDHSHIKPKKFIEYQQQQQEKIIESKSRKWWLKVQKRYFSLITKYQLNCLKNTLMNQYYLPLDNLPFKQQSYYHMNLLSKHSKIFQRKNIRVLFQNNQANQGYGDSMLVSYYFGVKYNQQDDDDYEYEEILIEEQNQCETLAKNINVLFMKQDSPDDILLDYDIQQITQQVQLNHSKSCFDMNIITQCNYFDLTKNQYYSCQLDRQIDLWQTQYKKLQSLNEQTWKQIFCNFDLEQQQISKNPIIKKINQQGYEIQKDVNHIKEILKWQHNLVNFKNGYSDKNEQMLAQALEGMWLKQNKTKNIGEKKKFFKACLENLIQTKSQLTNNYETDCKICFSTYVSDKNKVIYCDRCNQSFHEQCYGITDLDQDPESKFFCDACLHVLNTNKKITENSLLCQICFVDFSPLKKIGNFFFHPSCLFLNNLLKPKLGNLILDEDLTPQSIVQSVKISQSSNELNDCEYCAQKCKKGLRFKCAEKDCNKYFHSICAYLNSALFTIWRQEHNLQVQIRCWQHFPQRDHLRQIYLRRFFCNYKGASDLSELQLIEILKEQQSQLKQYKKEMNNIKIPKIRIKTSKIHLQKQQKDTEYDSLIILNSDDEQQNISYQNNSSSTLQVKQKKLQMKQKKSLKRHFDETDYSVYELKRKLQKVSSSKIINTKTHSQYQNEQQNSYKLNKYLALVDMDFNLENDPHLKFDQGYLADQNTNSNDSENQYKKSFLNQ